MKPSQYWWAVVTIEHQAWLRSSPVQRELFLDSLHFYLPGWRIGLYAVLGMGHTIHLPRGAMIPIPLCGDKAKPRIFRTMALQVETALQRTMVATGVDWHYSLDHFTPALLHTLRLQQTGVHYQTHSPS